MKKKQPKTPTKQKNPATKEHISSSGNIAVFDFQYQRVELVAIGFATMVIVFLWVGLFSSLLTYQPQPTVASSDAMRVVSQAVWQVREVGGYVLGIASIAKTEVRKQAFFLWDSSCVAHGTCSSPVINESASVVRSFTIPEERAISFVEAAVVAYDTVRLMRFSDLAEGLTGNGVFDKAYASDVLGAQTISPQQAGTIVFQEGVSYIDTISFGAISYIDQSFK